MIRDLKALGLALAAVFTLGAVTASGASAQGKFTTATSATLKATQNAGTANALTFTGNKTECVNATYTGHRAGITPHVAVPNPATEITITPHYGTCNTVSAGVNFPTTVDMNGCDYTFTLGPTTGGLAGTYEVTAGVVCPVGKDIMVTIGTGTNPHSTVWCDITIEYEPSVHYLGLHATNVAGGIQIHGTIAGFKSELTNTPSPHPNLLPCVGTHSPANGNGPLLDIDVTAKSSPEGTAISLSD